MIRNAGIGRRDPVAHHLEPASRHPEFAVIHHTDCGMLTFTNDDMRAKLADRGDAGAIDFLTFSDNKAAVRHDVAAIHNSPFIPEGIPVLGYIYDVETGKLTTVVTAST